MTAKWWKEAVCYQIYPRSFKDSNGDGIGDLRGIIQKLDYLKNLGVDVLWICPFYKSPQDDNGYDISDYESVQPEFGTMRDFDELLNEAHTRGMRIIVDLVINHTSDEHPWFIESRSSRKNAKRDWYIWQDGKDGKEPNNWESIFGGSAWELDAKTDQYYLHVFSKKQPDLNWENHDMRKAIYAMIRWWLEKGIDGFRIDAITHMKKAPCFPDLPNPQNLPYVPSYEMHMNVPGLHEYVDDLCKNTFCDYDIMTVGEANGVSAEEADVWVDEKRKRLSMLFQFEHLSLWDTDPEKRVDLPKLKKVFSRWQIGLEGKGWNALYVENHDIPRIVSKWGDTEKYRRESATAIATLYFFMQGTPFIYQGQEIGMTNTVFSGPEDFNDVRARNMFQEKRKEGFSDEAITEMLAPTARDNSRTPMQWNASEGAGFTSGEPWLKVNPNYKNINVADQLENPDSILNFYRKMIGIRKAHPVFVYGNYDLILGDHQQIYGYTRTLEKEKAIILCNLSPRAARYELPELSSGKPLLSNYKSTAHGTGATTQLEPFECRVYLK